MNIIRLKAANLTGVHGIIMLGQLVPAQAFGITIRHITLVAEVIATIFMPRPLVVFHRSIGQRHMIADITGELHPLFSGRQGLSRGLSAGGFTPLAAEFSRR